LISRTMLKTTRISAAPSGQAPTPHSER
jgi:hypothetical protein